MKVVIPSAKVVPEELQSLGKLPAIIYPVGQGIVLDYLLEQYEGDAKSIRIICFEMADEVGNLNHLLQALSDSNINVDYIYLSFNRDSGKPILILRVEDIYEVENCMRAKGFTTV